MKSTQRVGVLLLTMAGIFLGLLLVFISISVLFHVTLIYSNLYSILAIAAILTVAPAGILLTKNSKRVIRVAVILAVAALVCLSSAYFSLIQLLSGNIFSHPYDSIVYSKEDGRRIVELSQSWTWFMESFGGVEYKKAYVVLGIFYDNDLIVHTGAPVP